MIEIKNRYINEVIFKAECESLKECLILAVHGDANLGGANLGGANLWNCIGNSREIKTIQTDGYTINYTNEIMQIGCERHNIEDWFGFDNDRIFEMNQQTAVIWWKKWKPILKEVIQP